MLSRHLGQSGISVSAIGLGCMGLSEFYGESTQESEAINLLHRAIEKDILPTCVKLGISLVAYSPLGRGMLTGRYTSTSDRPIGETDFRTRMQPRFQPEIRRIALRSINWQIRCSGIDTRLKRWRRSTGNR